MLNEALSSAGHDTSLSATVAFSKGPANASTTYDAGQ